jgi:hypothetical protein
MRRQGWLLLATFATVAGLPSSSWGQLDPVSAGIAAGVTVEVLKGISNAVAQDGRASVRVAVQLTGPDADDKAFDDNFDINDTWLVTEDLDACVPRDCRTSLYADNPDLAHAGFAHLHYHYHEKAWRPNTTDYPGDKDLVSRQYVSNLAFPSADSTPVRGDSGSELCPGPNATCASAVSAFAVAGEIIDKYKIQRGEIVKAGPAEGPLPGGEDEFGPVSTISFSSLYFTPSSFTFFPQGERVIIAPSFGAARIDVLHSTATVNTSPSSPTSESPPAVLSNQFQGISRIGDDVLRGVMTDLAATSNGHAEISSSLQPVELTIAGAAMEFSSFDVARRSADGTLRDEFEMLYEYFSSEEAVRVVPPSRAQQGYVPHVSHREVIVGDEPMNASGIDDELRSLIPNAMFEGRTPDEEVVAGDLPMIGLLIGVRGDLLDALNLSARTEGTKLFDLLAQFEDGAEFTLGHSVSSVSTSFQSAGQSIVPEPGALQIALCATTLGIGVFWRSMRQRAGRKRS